MKFCIEKTIHYTSEDRVKITTKKEHYFNDEHIWDVKYMCNALIKTTEDFDINNTFPIVSDTCSIQIRPKGIFASKKGYFYKGTNKERVYLKKEEVDDMLLFINKSIKFLNEN